MKKDIKLNQILYKVNKEYDCIEEVIVIGLYNIEKVKQDKDGYFFNAPKQLVAFRPMPDKRYSDYFYNNDMNYFLETGIYKGPIEKFLFEDIYDSYTEVYIDKNTAEEVLKSHLIIKEAKKEKASKIDKLKQMIKELENT